MRMKNKNLSQSEYDIAYGCFLFSGVALLLISGFSYIPMDTGSAGGLGFLVLIPLFMASLGAMVVGIVYSVRLFNHWPLSILSLLSVLFVAEFFTEYGSATFYNLVPIVYGVMTCIFTGLWFGVLRKRRANA